MPQTSKGLDPKLCIHGDPISQPVQHRKVLVLIYTDLYRRSVYTASSLRRSVPPRSRKSFPGDAAILWPHECEKPAGGAVAIVASRTDASAKQVDVGEAVPILLLVSIQRIATDN